MRRLDVGNPCRVCGASLASPSATTCSKRCMEAHRQCSPEDITTAWELIHKGYRAIGHNRVARIPAPRFADAVYFAGAIGATLPVVVAMRDALFDEAMDARAGKMTDPRHDKLIAHVFAADVILDAREDAVPDWLKHEMREWYERKMMDVATLRLHGEVREVAPGPYLAIEILKGQ